MLSLKAKRFRVESKEILDNVFPQDVQWADYNAKFNGIISSKSSLQYSLSNDMILYPNPDSYFKDVIFNPFCKSSECQKSLDEIKFESFPLLSPSGKSWLLSSQWEWLQCCCCWCVFHHLTNNFSCFTLPRSSISVVKDMSFSCYLLQC